jgi:predicted RNA-binding Zn-ribbon protein involved in translation (DUF1610 family)
LGALLLQLRQIKTRPDDSVSIADMISSNAVVIFACPNCGMTYRAIQARHRANISDNFNCMECGTEVYQLVRVLWLLPVDCDQTEARPLVPDVASH